MEEQDVRDAFITKRNISLTQDEYTTLLDAHLRMEFLKKYVSRHGGDKPDMETLKMVLRLDEA